MIKALKGLDEKDAAGLLARAALSLEYVDPSSYAIAGEDVVRANILEEARHRLGIASDDDSSDSIEKLAEFLDEEFDRLLAPPDTEFALARLAERGDLPSDLYEINIIANVADIYGNRFDLEKDIIETTVRSPSKEQHYGPPRRQHEPAMISLFLRSFRTKWPLKDFVMLVAAQREGFFLHVHQAWRIYPSKVNTAGVKEPIDWLRKFSDAYGIDVEVEGQSGHFFMFANGSSPN